MPLDPEAFLFSAKVCSQHSGIVHSMTLSPFKHNPTQFNMVKVKKQFIYLTYLYMAFHQLEWVISAKPWTQVEDTSRWCGRNNGIAVWYRNSYIFCGLLPVRC
jgi:hypothetical protein